MKLKQILFLLLLCVSMISCSNEDNNNDNSGDNIQNVFLPIETGDFWVYDIINQQITNEDSIYIASQETINELNYSNFQTRDPFFGFYAGAVKNNKVRKNESQYLLTGSLNSSAIGDFIEIPIVLNDFIFFDENATLNQQLDSESGSMSQDLQGFPLTINYALKSTTLESLATFNAPNGTIYDDVKSVKITLQLKVSTVVTLPGIPIPLNFDVLQTQDVIVATMYLAKNIGVVHTSTNYQYELSPTLASIPNFDLGIPTQASFTVIENLTSYNDN